MIGRTLSHYKILDQLGKGGMGEVYLAEDSSLHREVAVKVLPQDWAEEPERLERFQREAEAVAALDHPNIVTIHSVEEDDGVHFITMQLVQGDKLTELIPNGGIPLDRLLDIAIPITDAISLAHDRGITHRDLKPDNVMVTAEGRVMVLDFGLAKVTDAPLAAAGGTAMPTAPITQEGRVLGTVAYMSPEQAEGRKVDSRSDVFSLGIVLYELATGTRPFEGDTPISTITSILRDHPAPVSEMKGTLPRQLGRIIEHCLAKDPERRYQTAKDLRNDLEQLEREVSSGSPATGTSDTRLAAAPSTADRGSLPKRLGLAIGAAAILGIAGFWALRAPSDERPAPTAEVAGPPSLAVVGFENLSDPEDSQQLGRMLMSLITTDLAESGGLRVASSAKVLAALKTATGGSARFDTAIAAEAAKLAGAETMLAGQLMDDDGRLLLTAELVDVASGNTLGSLRRDAADRSELFGLAGAIAGEVRDQLGVTEAGGDGEVIDLARALTDSPEAYRHYVTGELALHERRFNDADHDFALAVREDPSFALARYRQAIAVSWSGSGDAAEILAQGLPSIERLPERWQKLYRATLHLEQGEADDAYALLSGLVESTGDLPDAHNIRGEVRMHYSRYVDYRAMRSDLEHALEIDPSYKLVFFHLLDSYIFDNDLPAAERLIARYREEDPTDRMVAFGEVRIAAARRDFAEAARLGRDALRRRGDTAWLYYLPSLDRAGLHDEAREAHEQYIETQTGYTRGLAFVARGTSHLWGGRFQNTLADYDQGARLLLSEGRPVTASMAAQARTAHAEVLRWVGRGDEAIDLARAAIDADPWFPVAHYELGRLLFAAGRTAAGDRTLADFEERVNESISPYPSCWATLLRADRALALSQPSDALSELATLEGAECDPQTLTFRWTLEGEARERSGDRLAALAAYRRVADPPELFWPPVLSLEIPALYQVARLEEALGNLDAARSFYQRYLDRWGEADLPLPEVAEAKARLAAL